MLRPYMPSRRIAIAAAALAAALLLAAPVVARAPPTLPEIAVVDLPVEARDTWLAIERGGPFPYDRDGVVFGNREMFLPAKPRGYYHEYTVPTLGVKGRGARRIICGGGGGGADATRRICYYTDDHYQSFRRIRE
jgi:ribonuclease T1